MATDVRKGRLQFVDKSRGCLRTSLRQILANPCEGDPAAATACEFSHGGSRAVPTAASRAQASLEPVAFQGA